MSQIKLSLATALALLAFLGVLALAGCGDSNSQSNYDPDTGTHPSGWLPTGHAASARAHPETCTPCHGQDLAGGISRVACTLCHFGLQGIVPNANPNLNPQFAVGTPEYQVHGPFGYALHGSYVRFHGTSACANASCHGTNLQGFTGPSCTLCHIGGPTAKHPPEWDNAITIHGGYVQRNGTASCRNATCHGTNLQGVFLSGQACNDCHNFTITPSFP
jgi:hypothetical protein